MYKEENTHCDYILWSSLLLVFFMTSNAVFLGSLEICFSTRSFQLIVSKI